MIRQKISELIAKDSSNDFVEEPVTPCGMCRQVIVETEKRYGRAIRILMTSDTAAVIANGVKEILPLAF